jgi:hypothetical protein
MPVVYDHAVTDARRTVGRHQPERRPDRIVCAAGCAEWPCKSYSAAFALIKRNSNTLASR